MTSCSIYLRIMTIHRTPQTAIIIHFRLK